MDRIKFVNYLREQHYEGNNYPDVSIRANFMDARYLKPVLGNDPLLYYLEPEIEAEDDLQIGDAWNDPDYVPTKDDLNAVLNRLQNVKKQYANYRRSTEIELDKQWRSSTGIPKPTGGVALPITDNDEAYFTSYSYHGEHQWLEDSMADFDSGRCRHTQDYAQGLCPY
jgi:hypothetical protein